MTSSLALLPAVFGGHGGVRKLPWAFTEHGAIMAAMLLRSERAVAMSVYVVRAFVRMREELLTNAVIFKRLADGARQRGDGVVKCNGTARERLAGATRRAPFGRRVEQIDKKLWSTTSSSGTSTRNFCRC